MAVLERCSECEKQTSDPFAFPDEGNLLCAACAVERVQTDLDYEAAEVERLRARDARIIEFVGDMIDRGIWPYPGAVKVIGGREVMRRALEAMDRTPPGPNKDASGGLPPAGR